MTKVTPDRRFKRSRPCPVCGGGDDDKRGRGVRCAGYFSDDGKYIHCTREEYAGDIPISAGSRTYAHRAAGPCKCGEEHAPGPAHAPTGSNGKPRASGKPGGTPGGKVYKSLEAALRAAEGFAWGEGKLGKPAYLYPYPAANGRVAAYVARYERRVVAGGEPGREKTFRPFSLHDAGWMMKDPPGPWPLYRLPEVLARPTGSPVIVAEGEKCADEYWRLGIPATTSAHGAKAPQLTDWSPLAAYKPVIQPDLGETGEGYGEAATGLLAALPRPPVVRVLRLPGLEHDGDDIVQWLELHDTWEPEALKAEIERLTGDSPVFPVSPALPWGTLKIGKLPEDPGAPLEVLPPKLRALCERIAVAYGVDPGVPLVMILAAASGLIGNGYAVRITVTWKEVASLYLALIMPPGSAKSPVQQLIMGPVWDVEEAMSLRGKAARAQAEADYQALAEGAKRQKLPVPKRPPPPPQERLLADDATLEALARLFEGNPHGLFLIHDELCELFQGLDQYKKGGKGNSQAKLNKIHSHQSFTVDRTEDQKEGREPIRVKNPCLSIFGNLTPSNVELLGAHDQEGTLERWLPACPDPLPATPIFDRTPIDTDLIDSWREVVRRLVEMSYPGIIPDSPVSPVSPAPPGEYPTKVLPLSRRAQEAWHIRDTAHCKELNDKDFPSALRGTWRKMDMQALRLTTTLAGLWGASLDIPMDHEIQPDTIDYAWSLIAYFKVHHHRTFALGRCFMPHGARLLCNWLKTRPEKTTFSWSEITQAYPPSRYGEDLEQGKDWLLRHNAIREEAQQKQQKQQNPLPRGPGRHPSVRYEVHPQLLKSLESAGETGETG
ncbi:MAG: DUF3987 domain-containing protein, partial [Acidimicrobiia bacterium]|nr:DUF3987 domain-containing protein [Acidimicrobiia bacterium]